MKQLIEPLTGALQLSETTSYPDLVALMKPPSAEPAGNSARGGFGLGGNTSRGTDNTSDNSGDSANSGISYRELELAE